MVATYIFFETQRAGRVSRSWWAAYTVYISYSPRWILEPLLFLFHPAHTRTHPSFFWSYYTHIHIEMNCTFNPVVWLGSCRHSYCLYYPILWWAVALAAQTDSALVTVFLTVSIGVGTCCRVSVQPPLSRAGIVHIHFYTHTQVHQHGLDRLGDTPEHTPNSSRVERLHSI